MLGEVFRCTDTVVAMLFNRREIVSLSKLSKAVQVGNPSNNSSTSVVDLDPVGSASFCPDPVPYPFQ
jgi:hypothetical protein